MRSLSRKNETELERKDRRRRYRKIVTCLAAVVVFATTYALVLPAMTLDDQKAEETPGIETHVEEQAAPEKSDTVSEQKAEPKKESTEEASSKSKAAQSQSEQKSEKAGSAKSDSNSEKADASKAKSDSKDADSSKDEKKVGDSKKDKDIKLIEEKTEIKYDGNGYKIIAEVGSDAKLPADTKLKVREIKKDTRDENGEKYDYDVYCDEALKAVRNKDGEEAKDETREVMLFDISFDSATVEKAKAVGSDADEEAAKDAKAVLDNVVLDKDGNLEPAANVKVKIVFDEAMETSDKGNTRAVHFDKRLENMKDEEIAEVKKDVLETKTEGDKKSEMKEAEFKNDKFSVYGFVYTVDFSYEVNGKTYEFSMPGGGFVRLNTLMEVLGVAQSSAEESTQEESSDVVPGGDAVSLNELEVSEATKEFAAGIEKVEFSKPKLVWVGKTAEDATVGEIKEANALDVEYSEDLTKEQIEEINAQPISADEWLLISMKPFDTEETLTVTMETGEVFTIKVTDSQDPYGLDGQEYEIIVNGNNALSPVSETENIGGVNYQFLNNANPQSGSNLAWKFEYDHEAFGEDGEGYYISHEGQYLKIVGDNSSDTSRTVTLVSSKEEATPVAVTYDRSKGKYSFSNKADSSSGFLRQFNNDYFGVDGNSNSDDAWFELKNPDNPNVPGFVSTWDVLGDNIKIKLFDYTGQVSYSQWGQGTVTKELDEAWGTAASAAQWRAGSGVNNNRTFLFTGGGRDDSNDPYNYYTGSNPAVMQGIVKNTLVNGYPELTKSATSAGASLGYLFGAGGQEGVTAYDGSGNGLKGLLRRDEKGYYYFSSEQNYATLNGAKDEILVYSESYNKDNPSVNASKIGFFPFDPYRAGESKAGEEKGPNGSPYNHQFGMTMEATFALPPGGTLPNGEDMVFEFSGDDDVWVFIDDVLVLDLGGVHQPLSGKIDFAEGKSYVTDASIQSVPGQNTVGNGKTIAELFQGAGKQYDDSAYSTHTIKFFYLERGGCDSNCTLSFNLDVVKGKGDVEVAKYDKDANPVAPLKGVKFGLYSDPDCNDLMKEITSDGSGIVSFTELPVKTDDQKYYLKETKALPGYKTDETIYTLEAVKVETGKYKFKVLKDGKEIGTIGQNPARPVIYNESVKPIDLSVEKKWQDTEGHDITPPSDASATFKVQRYVQTEEDVEKPDTSFNSSNDCPTLTLPQDKVDAKHPWKGMFENLALYEVKNGKTYLYKYYIIETAKNPAGADTVYLDGSGNVIEDPSTMKTDESGTQTIANRIDLTQLTVNKVWNDNKDHSGDTINYKLYRIPYVSSDDEVTEYAPEQVTTADGYTGKLKADNDPAWTETITRLPKTGVYMHEDTPIKVQYEYYVAEEAFDGYRSNVSGGMNDNGTYSFTINNEPTSSFDKPTEVNVEKHWQNAKGQDEANEHDNDSITFKLVQKKYEVELYPVRINLINGDGSKSDLSKTLYMPKNCKLNLRADSQSNGNAHRVNVSGTNKDGVYLPRKTVYVNKANDNGREVTFTLQKQNDSWGTEISGTKWTLVIYDDSNGGSVSDNDNIVTEDQLSAWIEEHHGDLVETNSKPEYTMKLNGAKNGTVIDPLENAIGQGVGSDSNKWKGKVKDLPFYEKGNDGKFYAYTYEVAEVKIGAEAVNASSAPSGYQGETSMYLVSWGQNENGTWSITNKKKPVVNVTVKKKDVNDLNKDSASLLPGAEFELHKYTGKDYRQNDNAWSIQKVEDSANNGLFEFTGLTEGYYELVETKVPVGYVKTDSNPRFRVKKDSNDNLIVVLVDANGNDISGDSTETVKVSNTTLNVGNEPGAALPSAGGPGTTWMYILGSLLTLMAGVTLVARRRMRV